MQLCVSLWHAQGPTPSDWGFLLIVTVPTRFWPTQNVPANGLMLYETSNSFIMISDVDKVCPKIAFPLER